MAQDIQEAVDRKIREEKEAGGKKEEEEYETNWVDHSDIESEDCTD